MLRLMMLASLIAVGTLSTCPARACDPIDAVTDDRCDGGDRASGGMPAEPRSDFFARAAADRLYDIKLLVCLYERQYRAL